MARFSFQLRFIYDPLSTTFRPLFAPGPTLHCIFRHFCAFFPTFLRLYFHFLVHYHLFSFGLPPVYGPLMHRFRSLFCTQTGAKSKCVESAFIMRGRVLRRYLPGDVTSASCGFRSKHFSGTMQFRVHSLFMVLVLLHYNHLYVGRCDSIYKDTRTTRYSPAML